MVFSVNTFRLGLYFLYGGLLTNSFRFDLYFLSDDLCSLHARQDSFHSWDFYAFKMLRKNGMGRVIKKDYGTDLKVQ